MSFTRPCTVSRNFIEFFMEFLHLFKNHGPKNRWPLFMELGAGLSEDVHGGAIAKSAEMSKNSWKRWRCAERWLLIMSKKVEKMFSTLLPHIHLFFALQFMNLHIFLAFFDWKELSLAHFTMAMAAPGSSLLHRCRGVLLAFSVGSAVCGLSKVLRNDVI